LKILLIAFPLLPLRLPRPEHQTEQSADGNALAGGVEGEFEGVETWKKFNCSRIWRKEIYF
jgi:hypothetical protein